MKQNVDMSRGFRRFLFYLLISAAFGLFAKSTIQKVLLQYWSELLPEAQKYGFTVSVPELMLSRSGLPVVGAQINEIKTKKPWKFQGHCFDVDIQMNHVFLPLSLTQLASQKIELGELKVAQLELLLNEDGDCGSSNTISGTFDENQSQDNAAAAAESISAELPLWFSSAEQWFNHEEVYKNKLPIKKVQIQKIVIQAKYLNGKVFNAEGEASFSIQDYVRGDIRFYNMELKKGNQRLTSNLKALFESKEKSVTINANLGFDEGHLALDFTVNGQGVADVHLSSKQFPIGVANKWMETPWSFQFLWLNCDLSIRSNKQDWPSTDWSVQQCLVDGPHGVIKLQNQMVNSISHPNDLKFSIENLDMNHVIKGANELPLSGIFKGLGIWSANINFRNSRQWSSQFQIRNTEIVFSRNNRRLLQVVESIEGDAGLLDHVSKYFIRKVKIKDGEFKGLLAYEYNHQLRQKRGSAFLEKFSLSAPVQQLMFDGQVSSINLSSEFAASVGRLDYLTASLRVGQYISPGVEAKQGLLHAELSDDRFLNFKVQVESAKFAPQGHIFDWVGASLLGEVKAPLVLKQIHGAVSFDVEQKFTQWTSVAGSYGNWHFSTSGSFTSDRQWSGQWEWVSGAKKLPWNYATVDGQEKWVPLENSMSEWIQKTPEYLKAYPFVSLPVSNP